MIQFRKKKTYYSYLAGMFLVFGFLTEYSYNLLEKEYIEQTEKDARESAVKLSTYYEKEISRNLALTQGLAGYIKAVNGNINSKVIHSILEFIYVQGSNIRNLAFAPDNKISHLYPISGNEKALNVHYKSLPDQWEDISRAIENRSPYVSGPLNLIQGGQGLIYRIPVFLDNDRYFGIVSIVMSLDKLLNPGIIKSFVNRNHNPIVRSKGEILYGKFSIEEPDNRKEVVVRVPTSDLEIVIEPGPIDDINLVKMVAIRLGGWSFNIVTFLLLFSLIRENFIRKQIEQELLEAKDKAELASKAKSQFLTNMSHEIRTPLNAVMGFTQILQDINQDDESRDYLKKIQDSSKYLLNILSDILDFSKIEAGKITLTKKIGSLNDTLKETKVIAEFNSASKNLSFYYEVDSDISNKLFYFDDVRLRQVLLNIIGNAIKYTERGYVKFICKIESIDKNSMYNFIFKVEDSGLGMDEEEQSKLFQYFERGNEIKNKKYSGTGLGLAISKKLLELMGGTIDCQSKVNVGSIFTFTLSMQLFRSEDNPLEKFVEVNKKKQEIDNEAPKNHTILLVEDNNLNQIVTKKLLEKINQTVLIAENGEEAIEILESEPSIELVFMDISMPIMDGVEATKILRKKDQFQNLPIIALSAHVAEENKREYAEAGMNHHLPKPVDRRELASVIKTFLEVSS